MKNDVVIIPLDNKSNLYLRKDKIIATVSVPGSDHIDIYTQGNINPFHVNSMPADAAIGLIWGADDEWTQVFHLTLDVIVAHN